MTMIHYGYSSLVRGNNLIKAISSERINDNFLNDILLNDQYFNPLDANMMNKSINL